MQAYEMVYKPEKKSFWNMSLNFFSGKCPDGKCPKFKYAQIASDQVVSVVWEASVVYI